VLAGTAVTEFPVNAQELRLAPCQPPGVPEEVRCGQLSVLEDRSADQGRRIKLRVTVLPATAEKKAADPVVFLHGGPGAAASAMAPVFVNSQLRQERDIILLDQRGTGASHPFLCPLGSARETVEAILAFKFPEAAACTLQFEGDPRFYTTTHAVEDLNDVRRALGAERMNLIGASYGSRVALEYMRRYPEQVRTAFLRGVAGPGDLVPAGFSHSSQAALDDLLADCAAEEGCRRAFPKLGDELSAVLERLERLERLEKNPVKVALALPGLPEPLSLVVTRDIFAAAIHYQLYSPVFSANLPAAIHAAHGGDFQPALTGAAGFVLALASQFSVGMTLAVLCSEDTPYYDAEAIARGAASTTLRGALSRNLKAACEGWPRGEAPAAARTPVRVGTPTLLISGEVDPVTPPSQAAAVARHLPNSLHVVVPDTGHASLVPGCTGSLVRAFIERGSVEGLDTSCVEATERPPFAVP
jgi:pimeloyl-ACP methyl ester carboxylesterase